MAIHAHTQTMDVVLADGTRATRPIDGWESFPIRTLGSRTYYVSRPYPALESGEEILWPVASDVPVIVRVRPDGTASVRVDTLW